MRVWVWVQVWALDLGLVWATARALGQGRVQVGGFLADARTDRGLVAVSMVPVSAMDLVLDEVLVPAVSQVVAAMEEHLDALHPKLELSNRRRQLDRALAVEGVAPGRFHEWTFPCVWPVLQYLQGHGAEEGL